MPTNVILIYSLLIIFVLFWRCGSCLLIGLAIGVLLGMIQSGRESAPKRSGQCRKNLLINPRGYASTRPATH